jgi:histidyl-tRNA synthetase
MWGMLGIVLVASASYRAPALRATSRCARRGLVIAQAGGGRASAAVVQAEKGGETKTGGVMDLNPPRGTRDFYPEEMALRNWLFGKMRHTATSHGFTEYDAPVLESEELYIRKAGEDVTQQLYSMEDRSGRRLSLRPEMTPSLARMVLAKRNALPLPLKWFSLPQCWRYERMTRGRRREHYQWNLDVWGVDGVAAEVELLSAAVSFLKSVGLTAADVGIKLSTRAVLSELFGSLGVPAEKFASTCVLVDKLDKWVRPRPPRPLPSILAAGPYLALHARPRRGHAKTNHLSSPRPALTTPRHPLDAQAPGGGGSRVAA